MNDLPRPGPGGTETRRKREPLPHFAPVPRKCERHDGWTPERQRGFIEALADLGSVRAAANSVGMTPESAYLLRRHPEAKGFRKAWEAALALGVRRLEDVAMERALHGVEVPVYHFGAVVGSRRVYNDRLLMFMHRNRAPKRFAADSLQGADAATRSSLKRLKAEWRREWESERQALDEERSKEAQAGLEQKLGRWMEAKRLEMARAMRAEWLRIGGPPALPGDKDREEGREAAEKEEEN